MTINDLAFVLFGFCIVLAKFMDTFYGKTGAIIEDQVVDMQIQKATGHENEIINDGSVSNMVKRIRRENNGEYSNNEANNIEMNNISENIN